MLENKTFKFCLGAFCSIGGVFIIFILINSILRGDSIDPNKTYGPSHNFEVPEECDDAEADTITAEDIMVLDTMLIQVQCIEKDIDTLNIRINSIEDKIDDLIKDQNEEYHGREGESEYGEYIPTNRDD
tara:strand:- start:386 stop:772 length:387 start_codon:yes stop_codon:yes gene_type:complete